MADADTEDYDAGLDLRADAARDTFSAVPASGSGIQQPTEGGDGAETSEALEELQHGIAVQSDVTKPDVWLDMGDGKRMHKGTMLRVMFPRGHVSADRAMRVKQSQAFEYTASAKQYSPGGQSFAGSIEDEDVVLVHERDFVAFLAISSNSVSVAVGTIEAMNIGSQPNQFSMTLEQAQQSSATLQGKVLHLVPSVHAEEAQWCWDMRSVAARFSVSGDKVLTLNPKILGDGNVLFLHCALETMVDSLRQMASSSLVAIRHQLFKHVCQTPAVAKRRFPIHGEGHLRKGCSL